MPLLLPLGGPEGVLAGVDGPGDGCRSRSTWAGWPAKGRSPGSGRSSGRSATRSGRWEVINHRRPRPIDVVLGRSDGLGSSLFAPVMLPKIPVVQLFDYYYHGRKHDLADEAGPETPSAYYHWRRAANAIDLLDLENGVVPWTPTAWQRGPLPARVSRRLLRPPRRGRRPGLRPSRPTALGSIAGRTVPEGTKVVTFVARCLDRLRGFDRFLKLANALIRERTDVVAVVVGDPKVARALDVTYHGRDYREPALAGRPPARPRSALVPGGRGARRSWPRSWRASDLHVYPSRTYPVSRSLLQAMAAGRVVLASDDRAGPRGDPARGRRPARHARRPRRLGSSGDDGPGRPGGSCRRWGLRRRAWSASGMIGT